MLSPGLRWGHCERAWVDQTGYTIGALWNQKALAQTPLSAVKLALVARQVMARCDALDGVKDRLIEDPRRCDFDLHRDVPACTAGDGPDCLTRAQADTVMTIYSGPQAGGHTLFPGYMPASEASVPGRPGPEAVSAWMNALVPAAPNGSSGNFCLAENTMRYLVHVPPEPDYDEAAWKRRPGKRVAQPVERERLRHVVHLALAALELRAVIRQTASP